MTARSVVAKPVQLTFKYLHFPLVESVCSLANFYPYDGMICQGLDHTVDSFYLTLDVNRSVLSFRSEHDMLRCFFRIKKLQKNMFR